MRALYTERPWFSELKEYKASRGSSKSAPRPQWRYKSEIRTKGTHQKDVFEKGGKTSTTSSPWDLEYSRKPRDVLETLEVLPVSNHGHCPSLLRVVTTNKGRKLFVIEVILHSRPQLQLCLCSTDEILILHSKASINPNFLTVSNWTSNIWRGTRTHFLNKSLQIPSAR